ncbi:MAG: hypothetical protein ACYCO9_09380 [Streptosporangiaceae bacterium]
MDGEIVGFGGGRWPNLGALAQDRRDLGVPGLAAGRVARWIRARRAGREYPGHRTAL